MPSNSVIKTFLCHSSLYLPLQSGEVDGSEWQNLLPEQIAYKMALLLVMAMQMLDNDGRYLLTTYF